jgi:Zn ribbon nucleic-acid-binding protein
MAKSDVIYVECGHCGGKLRWIPREIQEHIDKLEAELADQRARVAR